MSAKPWSTVTRNELEADIERDCGKRQKARGWWHRKYKTQGHRSAPDRQFVRHGREVYVEFKRPGKHLTEKQEEYHREMKAAGMEVYWFDNRDDFNKTFDRIDAEIDGWLG